MPSINVRINKDFKRLDALPNHLRDAANRHVPEWIDAIIRDIRDHWSPVAPSAYGEPPAVRSGKLDGSLSRDRTGRGQGGRFASADDAIFWTLKVGADYAGRLEYGDLNRPFLEPALERASEVLPIWAENMFKDAI